MTTLLQKIIITSEKAANIARVCRDNQDLFELLVEEKKSDEANSRFIRDFKTLADVLIQETIRHDIQEDVRLQSYIIIMKKKIINNYFSSLVLRNEYLEKNLIFLLILSGRLLQSQ